MANIYTFGQAFTYSYYPRDASGNVLTPSADAPSIWVYSDRPSRAEAQAGTGSTVGIEITSWSNTGNYWDITIPAITDPDDDATTHTRTYWIAVNYTLDTSGDTMTTINSVLVSRPLGYDNELNVTTANLEVFFTGVDGYLSDAQQSSLISQVQDDIKGSFKNNGYEFAMVKNPERLKQAAIHRCLYYVARDQIAEGNEGFELLMTESKGEFEAKMSSLVLDYDRDLDGDEDSEIVQSDFTYVVR